MQTAHALAFAEPGGPAVQVRILLESGSQLSYITERQCHINLKHTKFEKLHLYTFGSNSYKTQDMCSYTILHTGTSA